MTDQMFRLALDGMSLPAYDISKRIFIRKEVQPQGGTMSTVPHQWVKDAMNDTYHANRPQDHEEDTMPIPAAQDHGTVSRVLWTPGQLKHERKKMRHTVYWTFLAAVLAGFGLGGPYVGGLVVIVGISVTMQRYWTIAAHDPERQNPPGHS